MTFPIALGILYLISALVSGAINWAEYRDITADGVEVRQADKVMSLYVVPLLPVINTFRMISILMEYTGA